MTKQLSTLAIFFLLVVATLVAPAHNVLAQDICADPGALEEYVLPALVNDHLVGQAAAETVSALQYGFEGALSSLKSSAIDAVADAGAQQALAAGIGWLTSAKKMYCSFRGQYVDSLRSHMREGGVEEIDLVRAIDFVLASWEAEPIWLDSLAETYENYVEGVLKEKQAKRGLVEALGGDPQQVFLYSVSLSENTLEIGGFRLRSITESLGELEEVSSFRNDVFGGGLVIVLSGQGPIKAGAQASLAAISQQAGARSRISDAGFPSARHYLQNWELLQRRPPEVRAEMVLILQDLRRVWMNPIARRARSLGPRH